jgi:hypothetical protein
VKEKMRIFHHQGTKTPSKDLQRAGKRLSWCLGALVVHFSFFVGAAPQVSAQTATPTPQPGTGDGAAVTFYSNTNLTGTAVPAYFENIAIYFAQCPPDPSLPATAFGGIFTAQLEPVATSPTTFTAVVQGGVRVIVNGVTIINQWTNSPSIANYSGSIGLTALQRVPLEVDYFKATSPAQVGLFWQYPPLTAAVAVPMSVLYSGLTHPATPPPQTLEAPYAPNLTVDGQVTGGAWSGPWAPMNVAWGENLNLNGEFQVKWDTNYLYLGCRIHNPTPHDDLPDAYNDDSIEFYLDTTNHRSPGFLPSDFQFFLMWGKDAPGSGDPAGVLGQTVNTSYGYSGVLAVPWSTLGVTPSPGTFYGMDVGANLCPQGGCPLSKLRWNGSLLDNEDTRPFGILTLGAPPPSVGPSQAPFFYPEPASGDYVNFAYDMREAGTMKLRVWNAGGNLAATLNDRKGVGNQISYLPIANFAPGHYFYQVTLAYDSGDKDSFQTKVLAIQK